jgi:hypothetical protein
MALKARLLVSDEAYAEQEHLTARQAAVLIDGEGKACLAWCKIRVKVV